MNKEELANLLNGRGYNNETTQEIENEAVKNDLVIVFGISDDLMELRGAIHEEAGFEIYITSEGLLQNECDNDDCAYFKKEKELAKKIEALWNVEGYSWTYKTKIPHATFDILEDGKKYCRGIVFSLNDI